MEKQEASFSKNENSFSLNDKTTTFDTFKGLIIMFISCFLKSLFGLTCKILLSVNPSLNSFSLLTYKVYLMIIISFIFGLILHIRDPKFLSSFSNISKENCFYLFFRSLFSVFSSSLLLFALKYMQISNVYSIYYTYPGIVIFLSYLLLKENFTWLDLSCFFASFIGAICVVRPSYLLTSNSTHSVFDNITFFCVLFSACFKASEDIIIRKLGKNIHWLLVPVIYACTGSIIYPFQNLMFTGENVSLSSLSLLDVVLLFIIALLAVSYTIFLVIAIQNENVGRVSMINYCQILFMFTFDIFIFKRTTCILDYIGVGLIFIFNFGNGFNKSYQRQKLIHQYSELNTQK